RILVPLEHPVNHTRPAQPSVRRGKVGVQFERALEHQPSLSVRFPRASPIVLESAQEVLIGVQVVRGLTPRTLLLSLRELDLQSRHNLARDLVLYGKDVLQLPVIPVSPQVIPRGGIYQLRGDAHSVACFAHAAFQHIAHPELLTYLLRG